MIDLIMSIAKSLFGLVGAFRNVRREHLDRIAALLLNIADCVEDIARNFRLTRVVPRARCSELASYFEHLEDVLKRAVPKTDAERLLRQLNESIHGRIELDMLIGGSLEPGSHRPALDSPTVMKNLRALDDASGSFRATGNLLKAGHFDRT